MNTYKIELLKDEVLNEIAGGLTSIPSINPNAPYQYEVLNSSGNDILNIGFGSRLTAAEFTNANKILHIFGDSLVQVGINPK